MVCYLPFDSPTAARRFIKLARPEMAFFIKYEFWRNYIDVLFKKSIPIYSVSSIFRPGQIFFRWYGRKYARCLRRITHFFVQNKRSVELLRSIGVTDNVTIVGDTRFDRVIDIRNIAKSLPIVEQFAQAQDGAPQPFVLVAGSSWQPDEDILLDYVNRHPEIRLVIAPHVVNDTHIQEIEQKLTTPALRYSKAIRKTCKTTACSSSMATAYSLPSIAMPQWLMWEVDSVSASTTCPKLPSMVFPSSSAPTTNALQKLWH